MTISQFVDWFYTNLFGSSATNTINSLYTTWGITDRSQLTFFQDLIINIYAGLPYIIVSVILIMLIFTIMKLFYKIITLR